MDDTIRGMITRVWRFHQMHQTPSASDAILVMCSHDTAVAERGAELQLEGLAPLLIFSGGLGSITRKFWTGSEAERFAAIAIGLGVPADRILLETRSSNTGENVLFTRRLLADRGIEVRRVILVHKPYMERRAWATFRRLWPAVEVTVTSPRVPLDQYLEHYANAALSEHDVISIMVGDLQRLRLYPARGFMIEQEIPPDVWDAFERLVAAGYDTHLVTESPAPGGGIQSRAPQRDDRVD